MLPRIIAITVVAALASGCHERDARSLGASEQVRPYLPIYAQFERWARRAAQSEAVLRDKEALAEAMFAPIRNHAAVLAAWVQLEGDRALRLAQPRSAVIPAGLAWVALRDPALGALRVATAAPCPLPRPHLPRPRQALGVAVASCVLVASSRRAPQQPLISVTVAFAE